MRPRIGFIDNTQVITGSVVVRIQRVSEILEIAHSRWCAQIERGHNSMVKRLKIIFLIHRLKGLSLSFQKIIKLTLLDQRN